MQETFSIVIMGDGCSEKKRQLKTAASLRDMSVSKFLIWLFDEYQKKQERKKTNAITH